MPNSTTLRLLIIEQNQNEAEALVSLFRNSGSATRAHRLTSVQDLEDCLASQSWDILLALPATETVNTEEVIKAIQAKERDIPAIILLDDEDTKARRHWLELGAADTVSHDSTELLLIIASRELASLRERRQRRKLEAALKESERRCELLIDSSKDAIAYVHDGMHVYTNSAYQELFGYESPDDLAGMPMIDMISSSDQPNFRQFLKDYQRSDSGSGELSFSGVTGEDKTFQAKMQLSPASFEGEHCIQVFIYTHADNEELEEKLQEIKNTDPITGLYNRTYLTAHLNNLIEKAAEGKPSGSLMWLSLDNYEKIKEQMGIANAETTLLPIAELIKQTIDIKFLLSRYGGEVFTALLSTSKADELNRLGKKLIEAIGEHMGDIDGNTVQTTASIGFAYISDAAGDANQILEHASKAAKTRSSNGGNNYAIYTPKDDENENSGREDITCLVQQGLSNNNFSLLYQPVINLLDDSEEHYEVLLRLNKPDGSQLPPPEFLDIAADSGLCEKLDRWVILQAIKALAMQRSKGHKPKIFLHLCRTTLLDNALIEWVDVALKAAQIPADSLIFYLEEEHAIRHLKIIKTLSEEIEKLGCKIAISHFGCTLNPFDLLKHIKCHYIKMDGSFTLEIAQDKEAQAQLIETIQKINDAGILSITPKVETPTALSILWKTGVNYIQGEYLQAPIAEMEYDFTAD